MIQITISDISDIVKTKSLQLACLKPLPAAEVHTNRRASLTRFRVRRLHSSFFLLSGIQIICVSNIGRMNPLHFSTVSLMAAISLSDSYRALVIKTVVLPLMPMISAECGNISYRECLITDSISFLSAPS